MTKESRPPLAGIRVLELANHGACPFAGMILRQYGAEVIKVEDPEHGDPARAMPPRTESGWGVMFARINANKKSIQVNLRSPRGQEVIRRLVPNVDVLTENSRVGRMKAWGLDVESLHAINPRLVVLSLTGFGQTGPRRMEPGFGGVAEAVAGFTYTHRWPEDRPSASSFMLGDSTCGTAAAGGVMLALFDRERTGRGRQVDIALYEPLLVMMGDIVARYTALGTVPQPTGSRSLGAAPRGTFRGSDGGWITLSAVQQNICERLFDVMGMPELIEDPRFATNADRVRHDDELRTIVQDWFGKHTRDEGFERLQAAEVPVGKLYTGKDIAEDEHFRERGSIVEYDSERVGSFKVPAMPFRISDYDGPTYDEPPYAGEHTDQVLAGIAGYDPDEIATLRAEGAIG
jgi:crotonobetainyl-CoA:carnitine CoA-transferase CaiB-like acyl-CoA transferase